MKKGPYDGTFFKESVIFSIIEICRQLKKRLILLCFNKYCKEVKLQWGQFCTGRTLDFNAEYMSKLFAQMDTFA